jgi:hypothetical protein
MDMPQKSFENMRKITKIARMSSLYPVGVLRDERHQTVYSLARADLTAFAKAAASLAVARQKPRRGGKHDRRGNGMTDTPARNWTLTYLSVIGVELFVWLALWWLQRQFVI